MFEQTNTKLIRSTLSGSAVPDNNMVFTINLAFIRSVVRGTPVVFEARTGPYSSAYNLSDRPANMSTENYVCNTYLTHTNHHKVDETAPGDQIHNDGSTCTMCHKHDGGFKPPRMGGRRTRRH